MRILYAGMRWDYGKPEQGESFEQVNFHHCLTSMGFAVVQFDFMEICAQVGPAETGRRLRAAVDELKPDLLFACLFTDQIPAEAIRGITRETSTVTFNWFCDDHWRFENFSRRYAPAFSYVATTDPAAVAKYRAIGYGNAILTQWACNHFLYKPSGAAPNREVTFVGLPHGDRRRIIGFLRKNGVPVETWGAGWPNGRLTQEEMIRAFAESRVNLNLANASVRRWNWFRPQRPQQIKGRNFEVPGCGGFLLTDRVAQLEDYFAVGEEVACYEGRADLLAKCRYYLEHERERAAIARAGYARVLRDHTYEKRFRDIFAAMGLS